MKIHTLFEMAAKKICPNCGKSMTGNHYWYKGGWKCKAANLQAAANEQPAADAQGDQEQPAPATPQQEQPQQTPSEQNSTQQEQPAQPEAGAADPVTVEVADSTIRIVADLKPLFDKEIAKINKIAAKVGAEPVVVNVTREAYRTVREPDPDRGGTQREYQIKTLEINVRGTTPRATAADGSHWSFVGVITPSATGRSMLKLAPGVEDNDTIRELYNRDPYFCDYCRTTRRRNETFIVANGGTYRQVGRNCLKDFVGGANPHTLLQYFSWFNDIDAYFQATAGNAGGGDGSGGRYTAYYTPQQVMAATVACVQHYGGYRSAKSETGATTHAVRDALWGRLPPNATQAEREDRERLLARIDTEGVQQQAASILQWFNQMPQETKDSNSFFNNVDIMVQDDAVESRMVGYIVGLYPSWQRDQQQNAEQGDGVRLVKEWPADWGDGPLPISERSATVKFVKHVQGMYGSVQIVYIMFADGYGASWKYSGSQTVEQGDVLTMTGSLEKDTYHTPARIKFVPDRKWLRSSFPRQLEGE